MEDLISVIVPIYQVEQFLPRCIDSIRNQTYQELEIILVDDGSPDRCGEICDEYAKKDNRIRVIHKANGGLSDARNAGIQEAKGNYFSFVDSDDLIHPQMLEQLHNMVVQKKAQIAICHYAYLEEGEEADFSKTIPSMQDRWRMVSQREAQELYFDKQQRVVYTVAWNKLYSAELFADIQYPKGKVHEDEFTTFKLLYAAKGIVVTDDVYYYYLVRSNSIMSKFNRKRFHLLDAYRERMRFYMEQEEYDLYKKMVPLFMRMTAQYANWIEKEDTGSFQVIRNERTAFAKLYNVCKKKVRLPFLIRMECLLFVHWLDGYLCLWRFVKK